MDNRLENLQRLGVWLLLMFVAGGGVYIITRLYSVTFRMVSLSHDEAFIAAAVAVSAAIVALIIPETMLSRFIFWTLAASFFGGIMTAIAPSTGLMSSNPLLWSWVGSLSIALGVGATPPLFWAVKRQMVRQPTDQPAPALTAKQPNQLTNQPTQPTQPTDQPNEPLWLEDNQPSDDVLQIDIEEPPSDIAEEEGSKLSHEVKQSVMYYAREGSYKEAAARLGKNPETIRKNVIKAKEVAPNWYKTKVKE